MAAWALWLIALVKQKFLDFIKVSYGLFIKVGSPLISIMLKSLPAIFYLLILGLSCFLYFILFHVGLALYYTDAPTLFQESRILGLMGQHNYVFVEDLLKYLLHYRIETPLRNLPDPELFSQLFPSHITRSLQPQADIHSFSHTYVIYPLLLLALCLGFEHLSLAVVPSGYFSATHRRAGLHFGGLAKYLGGVLKLCGHWASLFFGAFIFFVAHQLRHSFSVIWLYFRKDFYGSPTYSGVFYYQFPRFFRWLSRTPYKRAFSRTPTALRSRRSYLLFVLFFFSYFFRVWVVLVILLWIHGYYRALTIASGALSQPLSFLYFFLYRIFYIFFYDFLGSWGSKLGLQIYLLHLNVRRYLYYMNANEHTRWWFSIFSEKDKDGSEKLSFFDSQSLQWNLSAASPFEMPIIKPWFYYFFSRFFFLATATRLFSFGSLILFFLKMVFVLIIETLLFLLWEPFLLAIESVLIALQKLPTSFAYRTSFLKVLEHMGRILKGRLGAILSLIFLPFMLVFNLLWMALASVHYGFMSLFFRVYGMLWALVQLVAYIPMLFIYVITSILGFFVSRFTLFFWLFVLFAFGGYFLICVSYILGELLSTALPLMRAPYSYLRSDPEIWKMQEWRRLGCREVPKYFLTRVNTTCHHWARKYHKFWEKFTYDPFVLYGMSEYYGAAVKKRDTRNIFYFQKSMMCLYGDFIQLSEDIRRKSMLFLLYKLSHPSLASHSVPDGYIYREAFFLLDWHFNWVEYPALLFLDWWYFFEPHLIRWIAYIRSYDFLNLVINIYVEHYKFLAGIMLKMAIFSQQIVVFLVMTISRWVVRTVTYYYAIFLQWILWIRSELIRIYGIFSRELHAYLQDRFFQGNILYWYSDLLFSCWENQWNLHYNLLWQLPLKPWTEPITTKLPLGLFTSFTTIVLSCIKNLATLSTEALHISGREFFYFYLYCLVAVEELWDGLLIDWQLGKQLWYNHGDWNHYRHIRRHRRHMRLRHTHICRKSWFNSMFVSDVWNHITYLTSRDPKEHLAPYHSHPWTYHYRLNAIYMCLKRQRLEALKNAMIKPAFHAWRPPHWGYIASGTGVYFHYQVQSEVFQILGRLRRWTTSLESPFIYYGGLIFLVLFSRSFRILFFPKIFEYTAAKYWQDFLQSKDPNWGSRLLLPRIPGDIPEWYYDAADLEPDHHSYDETIEATSIYMDIDLGGPRDTAEFRLDAYREMLDNIWEQTRALVDFRKRDIATTLKHIWKLSLFEEQRSLSQLSPSAAKLREQWNAKFWPWSKAKPEDFLRYSYEYFYYDFKILSTCRDLQRVFFYLPGKTTTFMLSSINRPDFNLQGAYSSVNFDETEEVRAEYLFRTDKLEQRLWANTYLKNNLSSLDKLFFNNKLGTLFHHKDGSMFDWINEDISYFMGKPAVKVKFTPLLFSKYIHNQRYLVSSQEEVASYPWIFFWFLVFPLLVVGEGFLRHYKFVFGWSPRKGRYAMSEAWALWINVFLHFELLVGTMDYLWTAGSTSAHMVRAGSRGAMDEPGKWFRKSDITIFYFWDWLTHWHYPDFLHRSYFQSKLLSLDNLSELRGLTFLVFLFYSWQIAVILYKHHLGVLTLFVPKESLQLSSLSAMFAQYNFYKRVKIQLKKGLLYLWLKK